MFRTKHVTKSVPNDMIRNGLEVCNIFYIVFWNRNKNKSSDLSGECSFIA